MPVKAFMTPTLWEHWQDLTDAQLVQTLVDDFGQDKAAVVMYNKQGKKDKGRQLMFEREKAQFANAPVQQIGIALPFSFAQPFIAPAIIPAQPTVQGQNSSMPHHIIQAQPYTWLELGDLCRNIMKVLFGIFIMLNAVALILTVKQTFFDDAPQVTDWLYKQNLSIVMCSNCLVVLAYSTYSFLVLRQCPSCLQCSYMWFVLSCSPRTWYNNTWWYPAVAILTYNVHIVRDLTPTIEQSICHCVACWLLDISVLGNTMILVGLWLLYKMCTKVTLQTLVCAFGFWMAHPQTSTSTQWPNDETLEFFCYFYDLGTLHTPQQKRNALVQRRTAWWAWWWELLANIPTRVCAIIPWTAHS